MVKYVRFFLAAGLFCASLSLHAQQLSKADHKRLAAIEDTLKQLGRTMIFDEDESVRFKADNNFIQTLVRALRTPNSFYYPFDSLETVSRIYAPDTTFRIITWQYQKDEDYFRQRGAIQMRTTDGSLKLFPLIDMSENTENPTDSVRSNLNWIGAIYYKMVMKTQGAKKYYTLLGLDDNNGTTTKKWMDVLYFDQAGQPQFGMNIFQYKPDSIKPAQPAYRFCLEYKKDAKARLNYDPELDMIMFDHLVSETKETSKKETLVPDGDYEGFQWRNGKWVLVSKVYNQKADMRGVDPLLGNAPTEDPLRDKDGKINQKKLEEQNRKNMERAKKNPPDQ